MKYEPTYIVKKKARDMKTMGLQLWSYSKIKIVVNIKTAVTRTYEVPCMISIKMIKILM